MRRTTDFPASVLHRAQCADERPTRLTRQQRKPAAHRKLGGFFRLVALLVGLVTANTAAAIDYRPMIDEEAIVDRVKYEGDVAACQSYANRLSPGRNAFRGAVAGAVIGAVVGAIVGDRGSIARSTAGYGAVSGAAGAAGNTYALQVNIIRNCMMGRGYMILDAPAGLYVGAPISSAYSGAASGISRRCQLTPGADGCEAELAAAHPARVEGSRDPDRPSAQACAVAPGLAGCDNDSPQDAPK